MTAYEAKADLGGPCHTSFAFSFKDRLESSPMHATALHESARDTQSRHPGEFTGADGGLVIEAGISGMKILDE
jgi:hypothetical protein